MDTLINLFAKFSGLDWIWDKVDGAKTYLAAAAAILSGLAGVVNEVFPPLTAHNAAGLLNIVKSLPSDPNWVMLVGGVATLGLRHAVQKAADAPTVPFPNQPS